MQQDLDLPSSPEDFLTAIWLASGALFGALCVWIVNRIIAYWQKRTGKPVSSDDQRLVSIAVPLTLPFMAYLLLCLMSTATFSTQGLWNTFLAALAAVMSKQATFAAAEKAGANVASGHGMMIDPMSEITPANGVDTVIASLREPSGTPRPREGGLPLGRAIGGREPEERDQ